MTVITAAVLFLIILGATAFSVEGSRAARNRVVTAAIYMACALAALPLIYLVKTLIGNGLDRFDAEFFTHSMRDITPFDGGGGAYHAIIGTLEQAGIATLITVPLGVGMCDLHRRVRQGPAREDRAVLRRRHDRHSVDRRRTVHPRVLGHHRLAGLQRRATRLFRVCRGSRAVGPHAADGHPVVRGDAAARADRAPRGRVRARHPEVEDDRQDRATHGRGRHRHRRHAGGRPRRRRNRAGSPGGRRHGLDQLQPIPWQPGVAGGLHLRPGAAGDASSVPHARGRPPSPSCSSCSS